MTSSADGGSASVRQQSRRRGPRLLACSAALAAVAGFWLGRAPGIDTPRVGPLVQSTPTTRAIAVLPFVDMSEGRSHEHVADGVTEEIINALATLPGLRVAARTSAFAFKERTEDVRSIAGALGVGSVLEGSVRLEGPRVRITAQLIEASGGFHLWSDVYERELEDLFAVQEEIADAIRSELSVQLDAGHGTQPRRSPESYEAYQLYLRGRAAYFLRTRAGYDQALSFFEQSLAIDPGYAPAWAGISDVHRGIQVTWPTEPRDGPTLAAAGRAAQRAIALAPNSAEAHTALANIYNVRDRDWGRAEAEYREAIRLSPGWPDAHVYFANLLMKRRRLDEARQHLDRALELDPLSSYAHRQRGRVAYFAGDLDEAILYLRRGLELNPRDRDAPRLLWSAYLANGMEGLANEAYLKVLPEWHRPLARILGRLFGAKWVVARYVDLALRAQGRNEERGASTRWRRSGAWGIALALAWLGDEERMYESLERAADSGLGYIAAEPVFDPYRNAPRFVDLLNRSGYGP